MPVQPEQLAYILYRNQTESLDLSEVKYFSQNDRNYRSAADTIQSLHQIPFWYTDQGKSWASWAGPPTSAVL